jgi:adenylate cyclase
MNPESFFGELKRRNVIRMAGLYLLGAWLVVQVAGTVLPMFGAPEWLPRTIVVLLAIGFVPAVIFSWVFELTPEGLKREEDVAPGPGARLRWWPAPCLTSQGLSLTENRSRCCRSRI